MNFFIFKNLVFNYYLVKKKFLPNLEIKNFDFNLSIFKKSRIKIVIFLFFKKGKN